MFLFCIFDLEYHLKQITMASSSNRIDQDDLIYNPKIYSFSPDMLQEFLFNLATINNELTQNRSKFSVNY